MPPSVPKQLSPDEALSKFISYALRHGLDELEFDHDPQGWVTVDELLAKSTGQGPPCTRADLDRLIATSTKQRWAMSGDGLRIRAHQGHSVAVDLGLETLDPPSTLFHGTATRFLASILDQGLLPQGRHAVHLSGDVPTAVSVGQRYGKVVVLEVDTAAMAQAGHRFQRSANGVWLTATVPPSFLSVRPGPTPEVSPPPTGSVEPLDGEAGPPPGSPGNLPAGQEGPRMGAHRSRSFP